MNVTLNQRFDPMTVRVEYNPKLTAMEDMLLESKLMLDKDEYEQEHHCQNKDRHCAS